MKILSIDTSSQNCSVSIINFDSENDFQVLISKDNNDEKTHSQKLMPMLEQMFEECNLTLSHIDLLACCVGPGSFTGIRIGLATVKAFCDSKNIPVVGVTSLESLAYNIAHSDNQVIFTIIDAKNENVYSAGFNCVNNNLEVKLEPFADNIENSLNTILNSVSKTAHIHFIGNGTALFKNLIKEKFADYTISFSEDNLQSSISLSKCAYFKYLNGIYGNSNFISPIYLRKSQAERIADGESN